MQHGYTDICRLLLEHNARIEPPNNRGALAGMTTSDDDSGGLLGTAAFKGHIEILELLLDHRADVNGRGQSGNLPNFLTPLMHAAYNGHPSVVAMLLERKAQPMQGTIGVRTSRSTSPRCKTTKNASLYWSRTGCLRWTSSSTASKGETEVLEKWDARQVREPPLHRPDARGARPGTTARVRSNEGTGYNCRVAPHGADPDQHITGDPQPTDADGRRR